MRLVALLLLATSCFGQANFQPFVAGGAIYNVREKDAGGWAEMGLLYKQKYSTSLGWSDMFTDNWGFRELETTGRYWILPNFGVEAGYAWGFACYQPVPASCARWAWRTYTPFGGPVYRQKIARHLDAIVRMDITPTQLHSKPYDRAKDDGLRFRIGVVFHP